MKDKKDKKTDEVEFEKQHEECTFKPNLTKKIKKMPGNEPSKGAQPAKQTPKKSPPKQSAKAPGIKISKSPEHKESPKKSPKKGQEEGKLSPGKKEVVNHSANNES